MLHRKEITSDADLKLVLDRIDEIFPASPGTPEGDECSRLVDLVVAYEDKHYPIP